MDLKGRSLLTLLDYSPAEIRFLLDEAARFKKLKKAGRDHRALQGKNIVLLFEKTSTRTRCAFEVAGCDLGLGVTYLDPAGSQMGKKESIPDTARVLGRMYEGIEYRGFSQQLVETLARYAGVPVWNGLTDEFHPTQVLADLLTAEEEFGRLAGLHFTYMGDARNNVGNSLMIGCAKMGLHFTACAPEGLFPGEQLVETCRALAAQSGGSVTLTSNSAQAARGAHILYTDVWVSMGEPADVWAGRIAQLQPYRVTGETMAAAAPGAIFLHCLPAFHNLQTSIGAEIHEKFGLTEMEVADAVFESPASRVFPQAENRMHTIKAVLHATLGGR